MGSSVFDPAVMDYASPWLPTMSLSINVLFYLLLIICISIIHGHKMEKWELPMKVHRQCKFAFICESKTNLGHIDPLYTVPRLCCRMCLNRNSTLANWREDKVKKKQKAIWNNTEGPGSPCSNCNKSHM